MLSTLRRFAKKLGLVILSFVLLPLFTEMSPLWSIPVRPHLTLSLGSFLPRGLPRGLSLNLSPNLSPDLATGLFSDLMTIMAEPSPHLEPSPNLMGLPPWDVFYAGLYPGCTASAAELPKTVYYGNISAGAVLESLKYTDVGANIWSGIAIYEAGALGIVKGYSETGGEFGRTVPPTRQFGRTVPLTREEAIAIAYKAAGRDAEARQAGTAINNARAAANKKSDPLEIWYDGFLQLAANEGMISNRDLLDAFSTDQASLSDQNFRRKSAAQRQEMAYWLARALNIQTAGQLSEIYNYSDWRSADSDKLPFLEALLHRGIITGSNGRINPKQSITREQGAQIVKNAENEVLEALRCIKRLGIVENITPTKDFTNDKSATGREITVSNADGSLAAILTSAQAGTSSGGRNENTGALLGGPQRELVVYRNGIIGNSSLIEKGDRIQYITDSANTVKYIFVVSNVNDVRYLAVQVDSVDRSNLLIDVIQLFEMDYPDVKSISDDRSFSWSGNGRTTYRISPGATVAINGAKADLNGITSDAAAILTIDSNNLIRDIQCVDFGINKEARNIVRGIVEENNADLGYLTLFNEDGSGVGSNSSALLRTYNYVNQNKTEVLRNNKHVRADAVQAGDTVYIRLDSDGDIFSISAVDNYTTRYGRVISKLPAQIIVEYEDGSQQILAVGNSVIVVRDKLLVGLKALKDGDRIRLLLNEGGKFTELKEITIEGDEHYVSNIYKGKIAKIDGTTDKITVMDVQIFNKGNWDRTEWKGFTLIPLSNSFKIYSGNTLLGIDEANRLLHSNEAYIAVEKTYGGEERAVLISYRNSLDTPVPVAKDTISSVISGSGGFTLSRENKKVSFSAGSIVVKYDRLVAGTSLSDDDAAYLALNRDYSNGNYYASVVKVDEPQVESSLTIYRGRISAINEGSDFTVESFSRLQGTDWIYTNTPKTFNITYDTRVLNDDGVANVRDFVDYGESSYDRRTVYVAADGVDAVLVSTAPYGIENMRGTVYSVDKDQISLKKVSVYDQSSYMWVDRADTSIDLLKNTVIIQNGKTGNTADIKKGAAVRVIKKDTGGDGYIIFVE